MIVLTYVQDFSVRVTAMAILMYAVISGTCWSRRCERMLTACGETLNCLQGELSMIISMDLNAARPHVTQTRVTCTLLGHLLFQGHKTLADAPE